MEVFERSNTASEVFWKNIGIGRRRPDDPFFATGNQVCSASLRLGILDDVVGDIESWDELIPCSIPTCNVAFPSIESLEAHYNMNHRFVCSQCKKSLPSPHLLDLHLTEKHDFFFLVQTERKPMYRCYVESCDSVYMKPEQRRKHCIEEHKFPHDFRFDQSNKKSKSTEEKSENKSNPFKNVKNKKTPSKQTFTFGQSSSKTNLFVPRQSDSDVSKSKESQNNSGKAAAAKSAETSVSLTELMDTLPPL